jgi:hypothetical protein
VFRVAAAPVNLVYTGGSKLTRGKKAALSAKLTTKTKAGIAGRVLNLTLGKGSAAQSCRTGVTSTAGTASCTISKVKVAKGKQPISVQFSGDPKGLRYDYATAKMSVTVKVT